MYLTTKNLDNFFSFPEYNSWTHNYRNVKEHDEDYHLSFEVPGVKQEEISISSTNECLTIKINNENKKMEKHYSLKNTDADNIKASLNLGILNIIVPKTKESKSKRIEINEADSS